MFYSSHRLQQHVSPALSVCCTAAVGSQVPAASGTSRTSGTALGRMPTSATCAAACATLQVIETLLQGFVAVRSCLCNASVGSLPEFE